MQNYNNSYSHLQDCFCFVPVNTGADSSPQSCMSLNLSETVVADHGVAGEK